MDGILSGKTALVTGASSGIGRSTALALAAAGAQVALVARRADRLADLAAQIESGGGKALARAADVTSEADATQAVEDTVSHFGGLDILVNAAGMTQVSRVENANLDDWQYVFDLVLGFAVVAEEVRKLAEQSKAATAQVESILGDVQRATSAAVTASQQGTTVVEQGLELTARAGEGIRSLSDTIQESYAAAQQIAASAQQQSVGVEQIAASMNNVNEGTSQFLEGAHQSQMAAETLNELAGQLAALTERYRV